MSLPTVAAVTVLGVVAFGFLAARPNVRATPSKPALGRYVTIAAAANFGVTLSCGIRHETTGLTVSAADAIGLIVLAYQITRLPGVAPRERPNSQIHS